MERNLWEGEVKVVRISIKKLVVILFVMRWFVLLEIFYGWKRYVTK